MNSAPIRTEVFIARNINYSRHASLVSLLDLVLVTHIRINVATLCTAV
jgi:hypothetical protein